MAILVGIDLGTTNSACAIYKNKQLQYINFDGSEILPSCLYEDGKVLLIGKKAKSRGLLHPENYVASAKRYMDDRNYHFNVNGKSYSPEDVATEVLKRIYNEVKELTGESDIKAVITIPAIFRDYAIEATIRAGRRAGFMDVKTLKEPVSSVIANGIEKKADGNYMVIDLGGGTADISIVTVKGNDYYTASVGGDDKLGGDDFTNVIVKMIEDEILNEERYGHLDISYDNIDQNPLLQSIFPSNEKYRQMKQKILNAAEKAKQALSYESQIIIDLPDIYQINGETISLSMAIDRADFEKNANLLFTRFQETIEDALRSVKKEEDIDKSDIDRIVFAGGSMNLPKAKEIIKKMFTQEPLDKDLDKIVAAGAAIWANVAFKGIDPDPVPKEVDINLTNKLPYSLGVEIVDGSLSPIIEQGTKYPPTVKKTGHYTTTEDNQTAISFDVYEGNQLSNAKDPENKKIYHFRISGLKPKPARKAKVDVTFTLNEEGMLYIHAEDLDGVAPSYDNRDNPVNWNVERKQNKK